MNRLLTEDRTAAWEAKGFQLRRTRRMLARAVTAIALLGVSSGTLLLEVRSGGDEELCF